MTGKNGRRYALKKFGITEENKKFASWYRTKTTKDFIKALSSEVQINTSDLVQAKKGGTREEQGTWVHPHVAINFALPCFKA